MAADRSTLGILLASGTHERAHLAFICASSAAAVGRSVVVFATNDGCRALRVDWSTLQDAARDAAVRLRGVAGLGELRDAALDLGVRLLACESGLKMAAMEVTDLLPGVEVVGVPTFLEAVAGGQIMTL